MSKITTHQLVAQAPPSIRFPLVRLNKFSGATFLNHSDLVFHDGCFDRIWVLSKLIEIGLLGKES